MIEDQVSPKRCGHTKGKMVVDRDEAYRRIKAAVDARDQGQDIVILARTDSRSTHGIEEAIERCKMFRKLGYYTYSIIYYSFLLLCLSKYLLNSLKSLLYFPDNKELI
jgi:isocitrate lyase